MLMITRASAVIAVSTLLLLGCGDGSDSDNGTTPGEVSKSCTERDGAWFGRTEEGAFISSQTQEACEERLR